MRYTKSDLIISCWNSRLVAYNMDPKNRDVAREPVSVVVGNDEENAPVRDTQYNPNGVRETPDAYVLPSSVNNGVAIPKKFFNEEGEVDLSKVSGELAVRYIRALGINIVPMIKI